MDPDQGIDGDEGCSGWCFIDLEAAEEGICDSSSDDEPEDINDDDDYDIVDNSSVQEGNSLKLYEAQSRVDDERVIQQLKRKLLQSPDSVNLELSPRLSAISIGKKSAKVKRKLFSMPGQDSGYGNSMEVNVEGTNKQQVFKNNVEKNSAGGESLLDRIEETPESMIQLLKSANPQAAMLGLFKQSLGVSYCDLVRKFQSDKTPCLDWVIACFGVPLSLVDAAKDLLQPHCEYGNITIETCSRGCLLLLLSRFTVAKCRSTVKKLFNNVLHVPENQILAEPPKIRNPAAAMYWYKKSLTKTADTWGPLLEWIAKQVHVSSNLSEVVTFDLSTMIQWAYDNGKTEEYEIAYEYAKLANEDSNAEAFLKSNSQAKFVKDCSHMVKLYKKAEMKRTSMPVWIKQKCEAVEGEGNWRPIINFLKYHGIDMLTFISTLKNFLKGTAKKNCIVIVGPPNTGKSYFCVSLIKFLGGKVISFVNSKSHFWLQPLGEAKIALLDDATGPAWDYCDIYLRNLLDGNPVSLDCKHKAPLQIQCPPLLITSNINIGLSDKYKYLHSRVTLFEFNNPCPLDDEGNPVFDLSPVNWKCFFTRLKARLGLADDEGNEHGESEQPFKCSARATDGAL
ncbi:E1 protein [Tursiops truncatus papillomavirus 8]|nr:E1 protein [Tursiops truncatus papillomavirus 8]